MLRFVVVLFLVLVLPARANLGESVEQCVKRYGKPLSFTEANAQLPFGTLVFFAGPYQLIVFLDNTAEVGARVSKKDKSDLNPDEMKTIMDADASTPWVSVPSTDPNTLEWNRGDKSTVIYDKGAKMLIFTTPQMKEALHRPPPPAPAASTNAAPVPPKPKGNFAPAPPTQWAPPPAASTNASPSPATNAAPATP